MSVFFYNIFLFLYKLAIGISSLFNPKAKKWLQGRKNIFQRLESAIPKNARLNDSPDSYRVGQEKIIWMHCSSLGEFEQGRPVIERLKAQDTRHKILLTFFSPSGYEVQKNYKGVDWVFYLPMDGPGNAKKFLEIVNPSLVIFIKYDYWYYYLKKIKYRNIPLLLVSALFQKNSVFFKWYGFFQRKMLSRFDHLFVQNEESKQLLEKIGFGNNCTVSGDTRFDRVIEIAEKFEPIPYAEQFIGNNKVIIAGSTWKEDEEIIQKAFTAIDELSLKLIIAPHQISSDHIGYLLKLFPQALLYSAFSNDLLIKNTNVLIIDNIGMLSRLYKYAYITYVGGAITKNGVHNVLEAAVYGKPVLHGPVYQKYHEAVELVESGGAIVIKNEDELNKKISFLLNNEQECGKIGNASKNYVQKNKGATDKIMQYIQEKRLLIN